MTTIKSRPRYLPMFMHSTPETITIAEAIEVLQGLQEHSGPDAPLTYNGHSVDVSDFIAHI
jgi:hypothetical protein